MKLSLRKRRRHAKRDVASEAAVALHSLDKLAEVARRLSGFRGRYWKAIGLIHATMREIEDKA